MTPRGKLVLTILILAVVGFGIWRWWDKIAPGGESGTKSVDPAAFKAAQAKDLNLLQGDKPVSLIGESAIPPVTGVSDYKKETKNGKFVVEFPINVWPGWAPILAANGGMDASDDSVFAKKYGFYVHLSLVDNPMQARDLFASGQTHVLWGTLDMIALFAPELVKDSRTVPVVPMQIDFSSGGDGIVARGDLKSINDFHQRGSKRRKVVLAQNSPSHYLVMSLLLDAGIDPAEVDFKWVADAPSAAKIFVQDASFDAFVGWSPDIYEVSDKVPGTRLVVTTSAANHLVADVWAVRNDFYRDHKDIVANLIRGILEGVDMVRKNPAGAAQVLSKAYGIPAKDCESMIGKDGGITTGDAHLVNYRENANFFLDSLNPSNFEVVWNRASAIYKSLGSIDTPVAPAKVKAAELLARLSDEYKDVRDLSQPTFKPGALSSTPEAETSEILTKAVILSFKPNSADLDEKYDATIPSVLEEIGKLAGSFGNAYIVIEGNTDASKKGLVPADLVRKLSYDRADAVRKAIIEKYRFDPNKFKVVGNGWDNPLAGATDSSSAENNKRNRRVEVKVFPLESDK